MARRIDGLGVALVFGAAGGAGPDVFVGDGVGVFGGYFDAAVGEGAGAFGCPVGEWNVSGSVYRSK